MLDLVFQEHAWGHPIKSLEVMDKMTLVGKADLMSNLTDGEPTRF
jgi:hypothetical protein